MLRTHIFLVAVSTLLALPGTAHASPATDDYAYIMVVDHSGSMRHAEGRRTRWDAMVDRATAFIGLAPEGSRLWVVVFEGRPKQFRYKEYRLSSEEERQRAAHFVRKQGMPGDNAGTALFDALALALDNVERMARQSPGMYSAIMVYSDGKNGVTGNASKDSLQEHWDRILGRHPDSWIFYTPLVKDMRNSLPIQLSDHVLIGDPKIPVPVHIKELKVSLKNPLLAPRQDVPLTLRVPARAAKLFRNRPVELSFEAETPGLRVDATPKQVPLTSGLVTLSLSVRDASSLPTDTEFRGHLRFTYPTFPHHSVHGKTTLPVIYDKSGPPPIYEVRPASGSVFAVGQPVGLYATVRRTADVHWEFGDGTVDSGRSVKKTWNAAGTYTVTVKAVDDPKLGTSAKTIQIEILDIGAQIAPPPPRIFAGRPTTLSCTTRGPITRCEWVVAGKRWPGSGDGGRSLTLTLADAGAVPVTVIAHSPKGVFSSEEIVLRVAEQPRTQITGPIAGATLRAEHPITFEASATGPEDARVAWRVLKEGENTLLAEAVTAVANGSSSFQSTFKEGPPLFGPGEEETRILVEARLIDARGTGLSEVETQRFGVSTRERTLELLGPADGTAYNYKQPVALRVLARGPDFEAVQWELQDSSGDVFATERRKFSQTPEGLVAALTHSFLEAHTADGPVTVQASALLAAATPGGEPRPGPRATWKLVPPVRTFAIHLREPQRETIGLTEWAHFEVTASHQLASVRWSVNGQALGVTGARLKHRFDRLGTQRVEAAAQTATGIEMRDEHVVVVEARPIVQDFAVLHEGDESYEFDLGAVATLANRSTGDVLRHEWLVDGEALPEGTTTIKYDEPGEHKVTLRLWGPPGEDGTPAKPLEQHKQVIYRKSNLWLAIGAGLGLLLLWLTLWRKFLCRNWPRDYTVRVGQFPGAKNAAAFLTPAPSRAKLSKYWSRWRKEARVPLADFFRAAPEAAWWVSGEGKREYLAVRPLVRSGTGRHDADLTYSSRENLAVFYQHLNSTELLRAYQLSDNRAGKTNPYARLLVQLDTSTRGKSLGTRTKDFALAGLLALACVGAWLWIAYRAGVL